jgi:hypothetical protein
MGAELVEDLVDGFSVPETVGVFVVSGGDDFLRHVAVPNTDALYAFVIDRLTERPEVGDVTPPSSTNTSATSSSNRSDTAGDLGKHQKALEHDRLQGVSKPSDGLEPSTPSLPWRCSAS